MIIGISGKIGSGKDTVGKIIQYLTSGYPSSKSYDEYLEDIKKRNDYPEFHKWKIKKFAGKLKQVISLLTGYSLEDLEKQEIKDTVLGEEWRRFFFTEKISNIRIPKSFYGIHSNEKDALKTIIGTNHLDLGNEIPTVRTILQEVGTDAMRNVVHPNIWINALMSDYVWENGDISNSPYSSDKQNKALASLKGKMPNWIITDVRFENEAQAILDKGCILIRINREPGQVWGKAVTKTKEGRYLIDEHSVCDVEIPKEHYGKVIETEEFKMAYPYPSNHPSEIALDNYSGFKYIISNNGTIDDLIIKVRDILTKENILCLVQ